MCASLLCGWRLGTPQSPDFYNHISILYFQLSSATHLLVQPSTLLGSVLSARFWNGRWRSPRLAAVVYFNFNVLLLYPARAHTCSILTGRWMIAHFKLPFTFYLFYVLFYLYFRFFSSNPAFDHFSRTSTSSGKIKVKCQQNLHLNEATDSNNKDRQFWLCLYNLVRKNPFPLPREKWSVWRC